MVAGSRGVKCFLRWYKHAESRVISIFTGAVRWKRSATLDLEQNNNLGEVGKVV